MIDKDTFHGKLNKCNFIISKREPQERVFLSTKNNHTSSGNNIYCFPYFSEGDILMQEFTQQYFDVNHPDTLRKFSKAFFDIINQKTDYYEQMIILCIGTDRCTGDSFGPLVGYKLSEASHENLVVYGTLENPVHAKNLEENIEHIYDAYRKPLVVAIDACLGRTEHIGHLTLADGPLKPGIGVNKQLPQVGDISITGIVNFSGFMEFVVLQNTRLGLVMSMAEITANGIRSAMWRHNLSKKKAVLV